MPPHSAPLYFELSPDRDESIRARPPGGQFMRCHQAMTRLGTFLFSPFGNRISTLISCTKDRFPPSTLGTFVLLTLAKPCANYVAYEHGNPHAGLGSPARRLPGADGRGLRSRH